MRLSIFLAILLGFVSGRIDDRGERIDCFLERKSPPSDYSKEACLALQCLYDDNAQAGEVQCYSIRRNVDRKPMQHAQPILASLLSTGGSMVRQSPSVVAVEVPEMVKNDPKYRVDCAPDVDEYRSFCQINLSANSTRRTTQQMCTARGCTWDPSAANNIPTCYIPLDKGGYSLGGAPTQVSDALTQYKLTRTSTNSGVSLFNHDIRNLDVQVSVSGTDMIRMSVRDANAERYEVPVPIQWRPSAPSSVPSKMKFQLTNNTYGQVGLRVQRTDREAILFDTSAFANGFIYDDKYLQIVTTIPSMNAYGFGENVHRSFRHALKGSSRYGLFGRDQWVLGMNENGYGVHPFYIVIESNGDAFGVFIFNSNAQDYKFDEFGSDQAMLTYRTIGGILDVMFFAGPRPEDVIRQYQSVIGHPYMPPYWALGFQLSRYGYNTLDNMKAALNRTIASNIPIDVLYGDIDYFRQRLDFTWDPVHFNGMPQFVDSLHDAGMKFITILDPAIDSEEKNYSVYADGQKDDIWIKWPEGENLQFNETGNRNMLGYVWPNGKTVFPDFFYPPANQWWKTQVLEYHKKLKFDGLWIDMNEPANFDTNKVQPWNWNLFVNHTASWNIHCPVQGDTLDNPPYKTSACGDFLSDKTLCMIGEQTDGKGKIYKQYDVHNLYGWSETLSSLDAVRALGDKRSLVVSRSTFPSSGRYSGHWLGDNHSEWPQLKYNIIGMLEFNFFGFPMIGSDVCGFIANTTEEMCQRWMQLGAFSPFFRNHNGDIYIDQDPGSFSPAAVTSNRLAVELRYTLLPFLYTLFHQVHISGGTVVRSMAHVFPDNPDCWALDEQFLWDSSLLVAPVIHEGHLNKSVYLPSTERWYDYYTGEEQTKLGHITVPAPLDFIPLYLRGGAIIPHQKSAMNTVASRKNPMYLIVALDEQQTAQGKLFWDDGDSVDTYLKSLYNFFNFEYKVNNQLTIEPTTYKYATMGAEVKLAEIRIFGLKTRPTRIIWNGMGLTPNTQWTYDAAKNVLDMKMLELNVAQFHRFSLL